MSDQNHAEELRKLAEGQRFVMFTTVAEGGELVSRPMTVAELDGWVFRFIAQDDNDVTRQSDAEQVNLAVMNGGTYLSLSGTARIERDLAKKQELWDRLTEAYAGEAEDPNNIIIEVTAQTGEYWDAGNPIVRVIGLAKAAITGDAPSGDHGTAHL